MSQVKVCPRCGTEYPGDTKFCPDDGSTLRPRGSSEALVGQVIADRYHVKSELGVGGMGRVYLAEHVRMGRKCALKVLRPELLGDPDSILRFNREASNASKIAHTNVVTVYDFGETPEGLVYLAMEFVEGEPLSAIIKREKLLPPRRATSIACQVAEGLTAAHDVRIIHRDLKPENIMVAKNRDGSDLAKVVDFGIARVFDDPTQRVTMTGLVAGTLAYMSPEQLRGEKLDERTDIFALGVTYFLTLTGQYPFPDRNRMEAFDSRRAGPRTLAEAKPDVAWPATLQAAVDKSMALDKEQRFATAREFSQAIASAVLAWLPDQANAGEPWNARLGVLTPATNRLIEQTVATPPAPTIPSTPATQVESAPSPGFVLETIAGATDVPGSRTSAPADAAQALETVLGHDATAPGTTPATTAAVPPAGPSGFAPNAATAVPPTTDFASVSSPTEPDATAQRVRAAAANPPASGSSAVSSVREPAPAAPSAPAFAAGAVAPPSTGSAPGPRTNRVRTAAIVVIAAALVVVATLLVRPSSKTRTDAPSAAQADSVRQQTQSAPDSQQVARTDSVQPGAQNPPAQPVEPPATPSRTNPGLSAEAVRAALDSLKTLTSPQSGTKASASTALRIVERLGPRLTTRDQRAEAYYWQANAYLLLDRPTDACRALTSVIGDSRGTRFESAIDVMRGSSGLGCP